VVRISRRVWERGSQDKVCLVIVRDLGSSPHRVQKTSSGLVSKEVHKEAEIVEGILDVLA
jgi:hypothetical protein